MTSPRDPAPNVPIEREPWPFELDAFDEDDPDDNESDPFGFDEEGPPF